MMLVIILLFYMLTAMNSRADIFRSPCKRDATFKLMKRDAKLDELVLETKKVKSLAHCAKLCIDNENCKSINFKSAINQCEALDETKTESKLITSSGWKYYVPIPHQVTLGCHSTAYSLCGTYEKCVHKCSSSSRYGCTALANIARGRPAIDAPNLNSVPASRAVDGSTAANWNSGSCSHTDCCSPKPWWRVDFTATALVYSMKITNRKDCCGNRLSNFNIRIGNSTQGRGDLNAACKKNAGVGQGATKTFECKPRLKGRYLYIQSNLNYHLTICEAQVFGEFV